MTISVDNNIANTTIFVGVVDSAIISRDLYSHSIDLQLKQACEAGVLHVMRCPESFCDGLEGPHNPRSWRMDDVMRYLHLDNMMAPRLHYPPRFQVNYWAQNMDDSTLKRWKAYVLLSRSSCTPPFNVFDAPSHLIL